MKIWYVWGIGLDKIEIVADTFDEAIKKARVINPNYNSVQLKTPQGVFFSFKIKSSEIKDLPAIGQVILPIYDKYGRVVGFENA